MRYGAVVLCGGRSRRMGLAKADLPFGPETMLGRVVRVLRLVVETVVVVAAAEQRLPALPSGVFVARDRQEGCGPLEGLAVGLAAIAADADAAFVTACDVPQLQPALVRRMIALLGDHDIVVPRDGQFHHPLAAVYRTRLASQVRQLLDTGHRRPADLFTVTKTREVPVDQLRQVDGQLVSLKNLNCPADYLAACHAAGFVPPEPIRKKLRPSN